MSELTKSPFEVWQLIRSPDFHSKEHDAEEARMSQGVLP